MQEKFDSDYLGDNFMSHPRCLQQFLPVFQWRHIDLRPEQADKVIYVFDSYGRCNFAHVHVCGNKKKTGVLNTNPVKVSDGG